MRMTRQLWTRLALLLVIAVTALSFVLFGYVRAPKLLGIGYYKVTVQLPEAAGLYPRANVTYRGTEVGEVKDVHLTDGGVDAVLSLRSDIRMPADVDAQVHSTSAVGEQYVALQPRSDSAATLKSGDVIPRDRASVPPDINTLLDATNTGLEAIPGDSLRTTIDEGYVAFGGLGPEISRVVKGSTRLATDARQNLDELTNVIDNVAPVLDTQIDTSDSVQALTAHLADITGQLKAKDQAVQGVLKNGPGAADEARALFDRLKPTLPVLMTNLATLAPVLVTYQPSIEQILVLVPQGAAMFQATAVPNHGTVQPYKGGFLSFNLNLNLPPPCTTGYLPPQQRRSPSYQDAPDRPAEDLYCRVPQDAMFNVRGVRNFPCETRPGKRAPTVKMCESDENYVPLNDGFNWKGDPNSTLSGQDLPQGPPGTPPRQAPAAPPPIAIATYDPSTGSYVGPDGKVYTQADLTQTASKERTWQSMLLPPAQ
jgi:phospholipid/cholesterol/gamma-HCH transport system substrate-binding protein